MIPLHMAPYMKEKDFERFYWPTFKRLVEELVRTNTNVSIFLEHDFTRFLDYIRELPAGCQLMAEFGDPKVFKEKLLSNESYTKIFEGDSLSHGDLHHLYHLRLRWCSPKLYAAPGHLLAGNGQSCP